MNITLLVLNNFTNDARVHKEASTLAAAGHHVTVVALQEAGLFNQEEQSGYQIVRLRLRTRPWRNRLVAPLVKYLEFVLRLWLFSREFPADVYQANDANTLPAAWLAARRTGAKLVYDAHELETGRNFGDNTFSDVYRRAWAWPEKTFIRKADAVMTVNEAIASELETLYTIPHPAVVMNCPSFQAPAVSNRLRDELGIPPEAKVVLYQGRIAAGRGVDVLFDAVQSLPGMVAVALGDGPLLEKYRQRAKSGQWQGVYLPGKVPLADLPAYTASADLGLVLIQPACRSYELSLPNKLFEYIQAGIPVIGSDLPEIARVIREYGVGEVVKADDPQGLAAAIRQLIGDPDRYARAKANTRRAAQVFNWENEGKKLLALYQQIGARFPLARS